MAWNDDPQPTLTTGRLRLRPLTAADGPRVEELAGAWEVADTTGRIPHPYPAGGGAEWIATHESLWRAGEAVTFGVVLAEPDELVGVVGLEIDPEDDAAELGAWLGVPYWNRGYITEAVIAVQGFVFELLGLNRIYAFNMTRNPASARMMEKAGMVLEGVQRQAAKVRGVYEDLAIWAIVRSDWEATRRGD